MMRLIKLLALVFVPYFAFVSYLVWRGPRFIASMPQWVWFVTLCYFIVGIIAAGFMFSRKKKSPITSTEHADGSSSTRRALKGGLVLYALIFLNAIGLVVSGKVPVQFAMPGIIVDLLLFALFLWLLVRQQRSSGTKTEGMGDGRK